MNQKAMNRKLMSRQALWIWYLFFLLISWTLPFNPLLNTGIGATLTFIICGIVDLYILYILAYREEE